MSEVQKTMESVSVDLARSTIAAQTRPALLRLIVQVKEGFRAGQVDLGEAEMLIAKVVNRACELGFKLTTDGPKKGRPNTVI
jgi:hypothetical protein